MLDIYNRLATDQSYTPIIETEDETEQLLSQIKMVLGTMRGDVLGDPTFGVNIKQYLFNMSYNKEEIEKMITTAIISSISYDQTKFTVNIEVDFGKDHTNASDYAVINVSINQRKCLGVMITQ